MSWSMRRRLIIFALIAAVIAIIVGGTAYLTIHKAPSCVDNKQNQGEEGVDCGGPCQYLCTESQAAPSVRFVRTLTPTPGRTDVIAYIDNPNTGSAAKDLHYTIELYSPTNTVVAKKEGSVDLPPASTVPVFVPNFFSGSETVARAFITFDTPPHLWYHYQDTRVIPQVKDIQMQPGDTPRISATAINPSSVLLRNVLFIVTVFDSEGNAIASSQTIAPALSPLGMTPLVFTWTAAFAGTVSRIEVRPVIPLASP